MEVVLGLSLPGDGEALREPRSKEGGMMSRMTECCSSDYLL